MSRRFLYFATIGLVVASVILGLPMVLEDVVEARLSERLAQRDLDVTWTSLSWELPATIELEGVEFSAANDRLDGRADRVQVALPWDVAFADAPHVEGIAVHSAELTVELLAVELRAVDERAGDKSSTESELDSGGGAGDDISDKLRRLGSLEGTDIIVHLVRDDRQIGRLVVDKFSVSDVGESGRSVEATGEAEISGPQPFRLLTDKIRWSASGTMGGGSEGSDQAPVFEVSIGAERPDRPLIKASLPNMGRLSAHQASVRAFLKPEVGIELALHDFAAELGATRAPAVELAISQIGVALRRGANPRLDIARPRLAVSPSRLAGVRSLMAKASPSKNDANSPARQVNHHTQSNDVGHTNDVGQTNYVGQISWLLQRLDATVTQGRFDLNLVDQHPDQNGDTGRKITLVDGLDASLASGDLWARGDSAGGHVSAAAQLEPGMLVPRVLSVQATDVRLDDLPGVKEGRTLPNRGIRGRLGGVVDAKMMLSTQGQPLVASAGTRSAPTRPGPNAGVNIVASLAWKDGHVELSGLADEPLSGIDAGVEFELEWKPALAEISVRQGRATYGPMVVDLEADLVDWPFDPVFDLEARMQKIACQQAVRAFPTAMLGAYAGIEIDGQAAPTLNIHLPWHRPKKLGLKIEGFVDKCHVTSLEAAKPAWPKVGFVEKKNSPRSSPRARRTTKKQKGQLAEAPAKTSSVPSVDSVVNMFSATKPDPPSGPVPEWPVPEWPVPEKLRGLVYKLPEPPEDHDPLEIDDVWWLNRPFKKKVTEGVTDPAEVFVGPGTAEYVPIDELPPFVAGASYLSEEMEFYRNHGVDLGLIQKALRIDVAGERFVYGGSTVTQQLVKNLFLSRDKTLSRKLKEALIAWRIEDVVPKWRVLELYLNCIEYAQDVYGIGPAAEHYFGKDARDLTPKEAVFIAILKPAPWYGDRFRRRGNTPTEHWWFDRMGEIVGRLVDRGYLTEAQAEAEKPYVLYWDEQGAYLPDEN
jgi:hypothetical protein